MENYAEVAAPLIELTNKGMPFRWGEDQEQAFNTLKKKLISSPILGYSKEEGKFILDTDAAKCSNKEQHSAKNKMCRTRQSHNVSQ